MNGQTAPFSRALVTGGAGFIGSHLCRALVAQGMEVVALDNLSTGKRENLPPQVELRVGDIRDPQAVDKAMAGAQVVFHQAAKVSIRGSVEQFYDDAEQNVMGALMVLSRLKQNGVKKFMLASSMAVYADSPDATPVDEGYTLAPQSPYGVAKLAAEQYTHLLCGQMGIDATVLRYFNTYGPNQTFTPYVGVITIFTRLLLEGKTPAIFGDGEQRRDFVGVEDIVAANLLAMGHPAAAGRTYNVGTGRATSVNQVARLLSQAINHKLQAIHQPEAPGELKNSIASIDRIQRELGYQPASNLERDIGRVVDYIKTTL